MADDTDNVEEPRLVESLLLSVAHHWSRRETLARQLELLERHFSQEQIKSAMWKLYNAVGIMEKPKNRNGSASRTATNMQAEDLTKAITDLGDKNKLPRFVVHSEDLPRVLPLLGALSVGDERSVAARLEALEGSQRQNMMEMRRMMANNGLAGSSSSLSTPGITVTPPSFGSASGPGGAAAGDQMQSKPSYAAMVGEGAGVGREGGGQAVPKQDFLHRPTRAEQGARTAHARGRVERSSSSKRRRLSQEEESLEPWQPQGRPRKVKVKARPKVNTGNANMAGLEDLAGPAEFWIGNTRADTNNEKVAEVLKQAADNIKVIDFKVEEVVCLTKEDRPRTRSWKVAVPARLKEVMLDPQMYPPGWTFRAFTVWQRRPEEGTKKALVAPTARGAGSLEV